MEDLFNSLQKRNPGDKRRGVGASTSTLQTSVDQVNDLVVHFHWASVFLQYVHKLNLKMHGSMGGALCFPFFVSQVGCVMLGVNPWTTWGDVEGLVCREFVRRAQLQVLLLEDQMGCLQAQLEFWRL